MPRQIFLWLSLICILIIGIPTLAQGDSFTFDGVVSEVTADTVIVGGVAVDITNAVLPVGGLSNGMEVRVVGSADGQIIRATVIVIIIVPESPVVVTATPVPTDELPVENPVEVTVIPAPVVVDPVVVSPIIIGEAPIIVIEGPVTAINITTIVIFDIEIQVDPADEILTQIRIGDTIRVEGQSTIENNTIIIVAINITIIETTVIIINNPGTVYVPVGIPTNCRRKSSKVTCKRSS